MTLKWFFSLTQQHIKITLTEIIWIVSPQKGQGIQPMVVPPIAVFQPSKSKLQVTKETANYLGKSQVVAAAKENSKKVNSYC